MMLRTKTPHHYPRNDETNLAIKAVQSNYYIPGLRECYAPSLCLPARCALHLVQWTSKTIYIYTHTHTHTHIYIYIYI